MENDEGEDMSQREKSVKRMLTRLKAMDTELTRITLVLTQLATMFPGSVPFDVLVELATMRSNLDALIEKTKGCVRR
jgi:hypothetical protein